MPRMPHQPTTAADRPDRTVSVRRPPAPSARRRARRRLTAAAPETHSSRDRMVAAHTAAATAMYSTQRSRVEPAR